MQEYINWLGMEINRAKELASRSESPSFQQGYLAGLRDSIKWALEMNPDCAPPTLNEFVESGCEQFAQ